MNWHFQFNSISEFINMGGYAFYVWLAYGVTVVGWAIFITISVTSKKRVLANIAQKIKREERLQQSREEQQ